MSKNSNAFSVNQRINHHVYGQGTISQIDHQHTTIDFDTNGRRKFVSSMVVLEPSDVPAPEPVRKSRSKKDASKAKPVAKAGV